MRANSQKLSTSTDFQFTNPNFVHHNVEYKASMNNNHDILDEYDPTTENGTKRLAELARFEQKVLPCGAYTVIGQPEAAGKKERMIAEQANYAHIYTKINGLRVKKAETVAKEQELNLV